MAKNSEKQLAQVYYTEQGLSAKEISIKLSVTEKTLSSWVNKGKWKEIKLAKQTGPDRLLKYYHELLESLLKKRTEIARGDRKESEGKGIIDEISKISKAIDNLRKDTPSLRLYIWCIEKFTDALLKENPELYQKLIDFQIEHIHKIAEELK